MSNRVLIIDDEANIRQMVRLALETAGYEVGEASNAMEAFAILGGDDAWDVILVDQKMPDLTGTEVLRRLKVLAPAARAIMMTAFASVELAVEAMKLGATDFIRKPMTPDIVRNTVAAVLPKSQDSQPAAAATEEGGRLLAGTLTMNGFRILQPAEASGASLQTGRERRFLVQGPAVRVHRVVVEIAEEALENARRLTPCLPLSDPFWTEQAERFLSDFIWNDGDIPSSGRLVLRAAAHDDLVEAAQRANR